MTSLRFIPNSLKKKHQILFIKQYCLATIRKTLVIIYTLTYNNYKHVQYIFFYFYKKPMQIKQNTSFGDGIDVIQVVHIQ